MEKRSKGEISPPSPLKVLLSPKNSFSQFNHVAYHIEYRYMIPGFFSKLSFLGGVECLWECKSSI